MESIVIEYRPNAYPVVEAAVLTALEDGESRVILDLDSLDSLDTEGVRGLITLLRRARSVGRELALSSTKIEVRRTLQVTALDRIFRMVEAEAA
ncbi:MAG: STAS domain-containing protein [Candidatus Tumulicola sp.]